jgi:putative MATE family efflux protein
MQRGKKMNDKRIKLLRDEKISKAVNKMSAPAIVGFLVMAVYNIVDTMFVAWLGTEATGATQVVFPIMMLISSLGLAFGVGGGSYLSRLLGKKDLEQANKVASVALMSAVIMAILFTLFALLGLEGLLGFFGADASIIMMAKDYGAYIIMGSIFTMCNMVLNNLLRAEGSATVSMIGQATGALLNIALDPIFIFGFGWGIAGAAIATTLSQGVSFIVLFSRYLSKKSLVRINIKYFKPSVEIYKEIMKIGIPTFFRQVLLSISMAVLNNGAVMHGGKDLIAATGLVLRVYMMPMYILIGIGQGFQPIVGYNFGAGNNKRVVETLKYSLKLCLGLALFSFVAMFFFPEVLLSIFKPTASVLEYGILGLRFNSFVIILLSITNAIGVFYQAIGKGKESLILSIARQGLFYIPLLYLLPSLMGTTGILGAQLAADILTSILTALMFVYFIRHNNIFKANS